MEGWGEAVKDQYDGSTITVAMSAHNSTEAFKSMVDEFTALTGIEVVWDIVEETNLKNKQLLDVQGAGSYDVMMVDAFWMSEYASKNVLIPIDTYAEDPAKTPEWFDYEDIMAAYRNGIAGANGVNYGIPSSGETRFIAYRTDLFEKYGKTAPTTMEEFLELAQFFNGKEEGLYGVSMRAQRGIHFASGWMSLMYNFGAGFVDQSTLAGDVVVTTNTAETKESLQYFVDLLKCAPPDVGTYTHEEALGAFISGKTAMWLDATALAGQITDPSSSTVADKVSFVPTPTGPAGDGAALAGAWVSPPLPSTRIRLGRSSASWQAVKRLRSTSWPAAAQPARPCLKTRPCRLLTPVSPLSWRPWTQPTVWLRRACPGSPSTTWPTRSFETYSSSSN